MNDQLQAIIESHDDALKVMKAEIDALQISTSERGKHWYQQSGSLIAATALVVSIFGGLYSYVKSSNDVEQALHNDLRRIVLQLAEIPLRGIEASDRYAGNPGLISEVWSALHRQTVTLTFQAGNIVDRIPNLIKADEYQAVAAAFQSVGMTEKSRKFFEKSVEAAQTAIELSMSYRHLAILSFVERKPENGRQYFRMANAVFDDTRFARSHSDETKKFFLASTELDWAKVEAELEDCLEASKHIAGARNHSSDLLPQAQAMLEADILRAEAVCAGNNMPSTPAIPRLFAK